jgi:dCMP deaminase
MRISFHDSMMTCAYVVALRGTCRRRIVGAVIVDEDKHIISTGYNGVPARALHCTDHPCPGAQHKSGEGLDMCHAIHAEQNAIAHCSDISRAHTIYTTTLPCMSCMKQLIATPIQRIIYHETYPHDTAQYWRDTGRELLKHEPTTPVLSFLIMEAGYRAAELKQLQDAVGGHGDKRPKPH